MDTGRWRPWRVSDARGRESGPSRLARRLHTNMDSDSVEGMQSEALPERESSADGRPGADLQLTDTEVADFVDRGFVLLRGAVSEERIDEWKRLARSRARRDPGRYVHECHTFRQRRALETFEYDRAVPHFGGRLSVFGDRLLPIREVSPRAWAAACQLAGGEEAWLRDFWGDYTILGNPQVGTSATRTDLKWHVDDPKADATPTNTTVGLVPLILLSDIGPNEGATLVACDSVRMIAQALREADGPIDLDSRKLCVPIFEKCRDVIQATGQAGDVYLTHPFALHTASPQTAAHIRVLANPIMYLSKPLNLNRETNLSLLEQACLPRHG